MKKNIKGIIGYLLIIFGLFIPLVGFFGMSWNNITSQRGYENFKSSLVNKDVETVQKEVQLYNDRIKNQALSVVDPFTANGYKGYYGEIGEEVFAYLIIPKLNLTRPIYLDSTNKHLSMGIAQIDGTSLPVGGIGTRSVLAGHRGWYNDVMFLYLDDLEVNDRFYIENANERLTYEVTDKEVIGPSEWDKLAPIADKDMVTLLTCDPFAPPRPYRLLINAQRVADAEIDLDSKVESTVAKNFNTAIYGITAVLILAIIFTIFKFIKYLKIRNSKFKN